MKPGLRFSFATLIFLASVSELTAQNFGASPIPGSLFGKEEKPKRDLSGPSLSASEEPVVNILVEGNKTIPSSQILGQIQTRIGRPYDPKIVQKDVKKLASLSWFVDVQTLYQHVPEGHIIVFRVVERATFRYVEYVGNVRIRDKRLAKETGLKPGSKADPYAVEDGRRRIEDLYRQNGFHQVQVTIREGTRPGDLGVIYDIHEGTHQKIWNVYFEGANFVSAGRLKTQVQQKPGAIKFLGGDLDKELLKADKDKLTAYYRSFGFFQAKVGEPIIEYDEEGGSKWVNIRWVIHEGPRYNVRNVSFIGNQLFASDSLAMGIKMPKEEPFEQAKMNADVNWLKEVYGSQGYVFADVKAEPVFLEEPGQIDLVYHITEGKKWRVGRIFVHIDGENPHTRIQTALNRLSFQPGEIVDIREVRASERRLQASSLFHVDAMRSVYPKITYRIPELEQTEFSADGGGGESFRGQSPDIVPVQSQSANGNAVYEVRMPVRPSPVADDTMDVYLDFTNGGQGAVHIVRKPVAPEDAIWESAPPPSTQPSNPYGQLAVPTQNPYQPAQAPPVVQTPYSTAPPATNNQPASTMPGFGGQVPHATSPQSAPVGYGDRNAVQPAQFAAPPMTIPPPPAQAIPPGPVVPDPNVTPFPGGPQILPGNPWGPPGQPYTDPAVDMIVNLEETQTGRLMVGVGVNSDAGVVGQILLDERNFDWKRLPSSWNDVVDGTAFRGAGQRLRIEAAPGTRVQRYLISFSEPYLWDTPVQLNLSASYFDRIYRDWDEQRVGGRVGLGYQWTENDLSALLAYRGEDVLISNVSDPTLPDFEEVVGHNALHGFGLTVTNDTRDNPFLPTQGHFLQLGVEQVIGSFSYPRAEIDARRYFLVNERPDHSGRHVISAGTRLGFTGNDTPIYDRFFAGGYSTIRGFDFRGASPVVDGVEVGGDFLWLNSIEYLFPITADDMLHGVVFCDFGTVEPNVSINDFRVAPGVGLRINVPAMGPAPIALDFAWPVAKAEFDDTQVFSFFIGFMR